MRLQTKDGPALTRAPFHRRVRETTAPATLPAASPVVTPRTWAAPLPDATLDAATLKWLPLAVPAFAVMLSSMIALIWFAVL